MNGRFRARLAAGVMLAAAALFAQSPVFEAASIRPSPPLSEETLRSGQFHNATKIEGTHLDFGNVALSELLPYAFRVKRYQIAAPEWTRDSKWNILANLPAGTGKQQAPDMMRALLVERFKLATHREKREQQVYELVVSPGGAKLESAAGGQSEAPDRSVPMFNFRPPLGSESAISGRVLEQPNCGQRWVFTPLTIAAFADALTMFLDKPVVDATALEGDYKVALDINAGTMVAMTRNFDRYQGLPSGQAGGGGRRWPEGGTGAGIAPEPAQGWIQCMQAASESDGSTALLLKAVQKLGLELHETKAPLDMIVVDHLEKTPTGN